MSGPVAGAVGASTLCRTLDLGLAITADVGGTSFDTCLLVDGRPTVKYEGEVVGMPLQTPWVDVRSVGAGGGSIAHLENGLLSVGPQSAGAVPGPGRLRARRHRADRHRRRRHARDVRPHDPGQRAGAGRRTGARASLVGARRRARPRGRDSRPGRDPDRRGHDGRRHARGQHRGRAGPARRCADRLRRRRTAVRLAAGPRAADRHAGDPQLRRQLLRLGAARAGHGPLRRAHDHRAARRRRASPRRSARWRACSPSSTQRVENRVAGLRDAGGRVRSALPGSGVLAGAADPARRRACRGVARGRSRRASPPPTNAATGTPSRSA